MELLFDDVEPFKTIINVRTLSEIMYNVFGVFLFLKIPDLCIGCFYCINQWLSLYPNFSPMNYLLKLKEIEKAYKNIKHILKTHHEFITFLSHARWYIDPLNCSTYREYLSKIYALENMKILISLFGT